MSSDDQSRRGIHEQRYAVELRTSESTVLICYGVPALAEIAADLLAKRRYGDLVLVDRETGIEKIRWPLMPHHMDIDPDGNDIDQRGANGGIVVQHGGNGDAVVQHGENGDGVVQHGANGDGVVQHGANGDAVVRQSPNDRR